jgi:hypothetical protein
LRADHSGLRVPVEDVALPAQAVKHAEDRRWFHGARDGVDARVDQLGGGEPIVGVVRHQKPFGEQARGKELGRRVRRCLARLLEPADAFSKFALRPPENREPRCQLQRCARGNLEEPLERDAQVVPDAPERLDVWPLRAGRQPRAFAQGGLEVEACVAIANGVELPGGTELLDGVLADGLEQLIATAVAELHEQRLLDQPGGEVRDLRRALPLRRADALDGRQVEAAGKDSHPMEEAALLLGEEGIAPLDRGAERALTTVRAPRLSG